MMDKKLIINLILTFIAIVFIIAIIGMNAKNAYADSPNPAFYTYTFILSIIVGILYPITSFIYHKTPPSNSLDIQRSIFNSGEYHREEDPIYSMPPRPGSSLSDSLRKRNPPAI